MDCQASFSQHPGLLLKRPAKEKMEFVGENVLSQEAAVHLLPVAKKRR